MPLKINIQPGREKRLLGGHLWAFSNEIQSMEPKEAKPGDLAELYSSGKFIGTAFYNPNSLIACRLVSREKEDVDAGFFKRKLSEAKAYRERVIPGETSYRLCFGESDGLPGLVVDRYGDVLVLQVLSAGIEVRLDALVAALKELFDPRCILAKNDHRARGLEGLPSGDKVLHGGLPEKATISESGLRFTALAGEGQKTGHYFDQRDNRVFLRPFFKDRIVLDLYTYTGAFAINAAKFGAKSVLAIDSSGPAVEAGRENAKLNGVEVEFDENDAEDVLQSFSEGKQPFKPDMILLDPPSLVPAKKHLPKALRTYHKLNSQALKALPKGGLLATSTCSHHVSREDFVLMLRNAAAKAQRVTRMIALRGQGADHPVLLTMPETEYLHFALLEVL
jgi:23S rRNA (cytosine1962-C5)-methyltransferase